MRIMRFLRGALSPLVYNEKELSLVSKIIPGDVYLKDQATKDHFITYSDNYQIIHLATHGKSNDQVGELSFIAFSEIPDSTDGNNKLFVKDLYGMRLNADLVVLSACETGLGELRNGSGLVSIAQGFTYAGAKSLVTSLWRIYDHPNTVQFMETFYQYIKQGDDIDYAIWKTKNKMISQSQTAHPYFWAGFIPVGAMDAIPLITPNISWWILSVALFLLLGGLFWRFKRYRSTVLIR